MSKYTIITSCSEEYLDFYIEAGLDFDNLSIYLHNNISTEEYSEELISFDEVYKKQDLIKYLLILKKN